MCKRVVALAILTLWNVGELSAGPPTDSESINVGAEHSLVGPSHPSFVPSLSDILPGYYVEVGGVYLRRDTYQDDVVGAMRFGGLALAENRSTSLDFTNEPGIRATV